LNRANVSEWESIAAEFPSLSGIIDSTLANLNNFNNFLGLNIINSPWYTMKQSISSGEYLLLIAAILIPVLAGLTQWLNVRLMPQAAASNGSSEQDDMMRSMKMMNNFMPLMSVYFCAILPTGVGLYWIMSAVVRMIQQFVINKKLSKMDLEAEIKKNLEKYNEKRAKNGLPPERPERINQMARASVKSAEAPKREITEEERQKALRESTEYYNRGAAKPGSLAAKARMVEQYNEKHKK